MRLIPVSTQSGTTYVNPDAVVTVREPLKSDAAIIKTVIVVLTGSVSVTEEIEAVVAKLTAE